MFSELDDELLEPIVDQSKTLDFREVTFCFNQGRLQ